MRHLKAGRRPGPDHGASLAMLRNLVTAVGEGAGGNHPGQGQGGRQWAEKVITWLNGVTCTPGADPGGGALQEGGGQTLWRIAGAVSGPTRGYTRIIPLGLRLGDGSPCPSGAGGSPETLPKPRKRRPPKAELFAIGGQGLV